MLFQLNIIGLIEKKSFNTCMDDIRQWVRVTKVKKMATLFSPFQTSLKIDLLWPPKINIQIQRSTKYSTLAPPL